ncbi:MAG: hypothetical protein ACRDRT_14050, partial [Pseudonocardiaceae bacterium]
CRGDSGGVPPYLDLYRQAPRDAEPGDECEAPHQRAEIGMHRRDAHHGEPGEPGPEREDNHKRARGEAAPGRR